jgi:hypothetical protein
MALIRLVLFALIALVAIGFYRGWFTLSRSAPGKNGEKVNINMSVDEGKMKSDVKKAEEKVKERVKAFEEKVKANQATK